MINVPFTVRFALPVYLLPFWSKTVPLTVTISVMLTVSFASTVTVRFDTYTVVFAVAFSRSGLLPLIAKVPLETPVISTLVLPYISSSLYDNLKLDASMSFTTVSSSPFSTCNLIGFPSLSVIGFPSPSTKSISPVYKSPSLIKLPFTVIFTLFSNGFSILVVVLIFPLTVSV